MKNAFYKFMPLLLGLFLVMRARRTAPASVAEQPLTEEEARQLEETLQSKD